MDRHRPMPPESLREPGYRPLRYSFVGFEGYLDAVLLVEALRKMGPDLDRVRFKAAVEALDRVDLGINAPVSFGPKKHQGLDRVYYTVVDEGRFVPLTDWERWRQ
jgi:hypothetical protein